MAKPKQKSSDPESGSAIEIGAGGLIVLVLALGLVAAGAWFLLRRPAGSAPAAPVSATAPGLPSSAAAGNTQLTPVPGALGTVSAAGGGETYRGQPAGVTSDGDHVLGPASAPVTLIVFSDYQCPNCRQFAVDVLPWLTERWMPTGLVRVVYRDFVVRGPESQQAAEAAQCAGEQGHFWAYHDLLFQAQHGENAGAFAPEALRALAAGAGLDADALMACVQTGRQRGRVEAATTFARQQGFEGTPAYVINGRPTSGAIPVARWEELFRLYATQFGLAAPDASPAPGATG
jgi:protein-disulfide isomerase